MKTARVVFIIFGWLVIFLQVISYIGRFKKKVLVSPGLKLPISSHGTFCCYQVFLFYSLPEGKRPKERSSTRELESLFEKPGEKNITGRI